MCGTSWPSPDSETPAGPRAGVTRPLDGIRVLDFATLLPGPFATQILAAAGASVVKVERPGQGEEMRSYVPRLGAHSVNFALLNRGKRSVAVDLKAPGALGRLRPLLEEADVLVEQFRPGVMDRLGLGYGEVRGLNPKIIYCSISGYGQQGPKAHTAGHDLNYLADTGLLDLCRDPTGAPPLPPALIADLAGGAFPALCNILLALLLRQRTGVGTYLDISMAGNLFPLMYWAWGAGHAASEWPVPGAELVTGGSPRYQVYRTADGRFLAVAALEQRFWHRFCDLIGLGIDQRDDAADPSSVRKSVAERIAARPATEWQQILTGQDVCCTVVRSLQEAVLDQQFRQMWPTADTVADGGHAIPSLPLPLAPSLQTQPRRQAAPGVGEHNRLLA